MFTGLLTTATRALSTMHRRIITTPTRGGEKFTNSALGVFMKKNYKAASKGNKKSMQVLGDLQKKFKRLSESQVATYEKVASQNRKAIQRRRAVFKAARVNPYAVFMKENYAKAAKSAKSFTAASKQISREWKGLGSAGRAAFSRKVEKLRRAAAAQRDRMIAKYSA